MANASFLRSLLSSPGIVTAPTERRLLVARASSSRRGGSRRQRRVHAAGHHARFSPARPSRSRQARCLPALLLGVWWKRANGQGALAGMIAGLRRLPLLHGGAALFPLRLLRDLERPLQCDRDASRGLQRRYGRAIISPIAQTRGGRLALWEIKVRAIANWWGVERHASPACSACRSALVVMICRQPVHAGAIRGRAELRRGSAQGATGLAARALLRRRIAAAARRIATDRASTRKESRKRSASSSVAWPLGPPTPA